MFSSIIDLNTSSTCDNQKCLHSLPNVSIEWWRTAVLEGYLIFSSKWYLYKVNSSQLPMCLNLQWSLSDTQRIYLSCFSWGIRGVGMFTLNVIGSFKWNFKDLKGRKVLISWLINQQINTHTHTHTYVEKLGRHRIRHKDAASLASFPPLNASFIGYLTCGLSLPSPGSEGC